MWGLLGVDPCKSDICIFAQHEGYKIHWVLIPRKSDICVFAQYEGYNVY
jgi:hypothetical protein